MWVPGEASLLLDREPCERAVLEAWSGSKRLIGPGTRGGPFRNPNSIHLMIRPQVISRFLLSS